MMSSHLVLALPLISILGVATSTDLVDRRIPNGLTIGGAVVGLVFNAYLFGPAGFGLALLGCLFCLVCFLPLYAGGGMAAGDVKLMGMVGAFLGPVNGFVACIFTLVIGAILASLSLGWTKLVRRMTGLRWAGHADVVNAASTMHAAEKIPYALAILLGTIATLLQPKWLTGLLQLEALQ
jgi:prepilin peptidase CpaA